MKKIYISFLSVCIAVFLVMNIFSFTFYKQLKGDSYSFDELFPDCEDVYFGMTVNDNLKNEFEKSEFHPAEYKVFKAVKDSELIDCIRVNVLCINDDFQFVSGYIVKYSEEYYMVFLAKTKYRVEYCMFRIESENKQFDFIADGLVEEEFFKGMISTVNSVYSFRNSFERVFNKYCLRQNLSILAITLIGTVVYVVISKECKNKST